MDFMLDEPTGHRPFTIIVEKRFCFTFTHLFTPFESNTILLVSFFESTSLEQKINEGSLTH